MPLRFAAARIPSRSPIARALAKKAPSRPVNDNGTAQMPEGSRIDGVMRAALRHFAEHGLAAAQVARQQAEGAYFSGDMQAYRWWLEMCRTLDRRLAEHLEHSMVIEDLLAR